jgi:hypothetical protein
MECAMRVANRVVELSEAGETTLQQLIVADQLRSYPAAKAEIPELAYVERVFVKARARVKNRAENSHRHDACSSHHNLVDTILDEPRQLRDTACGDG